MRVDNNILIPELARLVADEKEVRFTPSGVSMRPFIEGDKDSVILAPLSRPPRRGDVILAQVRNAAGLPTYVLHRLIRIENNEPDEPVYVLQGDGNIRGEERCSRGGIIGQVIRVESPSGRRKPLTKGRLWYALRPIRKWLLKIYRHTILIWLYENN